MANHRSRFLLRRNPANLMPKKHIANKAVLFFVLLLTVAIFCFGSFAIVAAEKILYYYSQGLPPAVVKETSYPGTIKVYDKDGNLLYRDIGQEDSTYVKIDNISPYFLEAIITAEDQNFFEHHGIDLWAIFRAMWHDFQRKELAEGASTITQQLARNLFLTREVSFERKIREIILADRLEKKYTKKQILEFYVNKIPFGSNIYGVEAASQVFFGKPSKMLNLAEAAALAVLPRSPNQLFPYKNSQALLEKRNELLKQMAARHVITPAEFSRARAQAITLQPRTNNLLAPHFTFYVLGKIKQNFNPSAYRQGLDIITTLDLSLQQKLSQLLKATVMRYKKPYHINDGAIVAINAKNGNILAMAGSYNFWGKEYGQYNSAIAQRQPGSTLKPFIYALAIQDLGWSKKTVLKDEPVDFNGYRPRNFGGGFRGKVTLQAALVNSLNIPAVKTLNQLGVQKLADTLSNCQVNLDTKAGLAMAVGGASTSLLDLTAAYTAFVNNGKCISSNYFLKIKENNGRTLLDNLKARTHQVFSSNAVAQINSILQKSLGNFSLTRSLVRDPLLKNAAVKTGTSNGPRDLWAIGYNSDIIIGVWLGNNDNSLLRRDVYGLQLAVPLWAQAMRVAAQEAR